jgi:hypothetical protein
LADRTVFLTLEQVGRLWAALRSNARVLLDAVLVGLGRLPETNLPKLPRMADSARWATACETAGTF